jgi:hypothetical protein
MSKDQPGVVYPRFLGVDSNGDFVWELASGRWTWGDDPYQANQRQRTFTADRYLEKYGPVTQLPESGLLGHSAVPADQPGAIVSPAGWCAPAGARTGISPEALDAAVAQAFEDGKRRGAEETEHADTQAGRILALAAMERVAKGWADGAAENEEAMGRRDRKPSDEQPFVLADILNMIDDAAREVGVAPVYSERSKRP